MTTQVEPIRGKVAKVINSRQVALNIGRNHGVRHGMRFDITEPEGMSIKDPDTDEVLGSFSAPKTRVKVIHADDRLSVAVTYRAKNVMVRDYDPNARTILGTVRLFQPAKLEPRFETLDVPFGFSPANGESDRRSSPVADGDPVVQVIDIGDSDDWRLL